MLKTYIGAACATLALTVTSANAIENICDAVLTSRSFNTYNSVYQQNIASTTVSLICTLHISSRQALQEQQANLQSGGQYGIISGFFNAAESSGSQSWESTYDRACNKHDTSFVSSVFSSQQSQMTDANVTAWERCVESRKGLFSSFQMSQDNKTATVTVRYIKPDIAPVKLQLHAIDKKYGFDCSVNGKDIAGFVPEDNGVLGRFSVACSRTSDATNNTLLISANVDQIGPFDVPSKAFSELSSKVDALQKRTEDQGSQLSSALSKQEAMLAAFGGGRVLGIAEVVNGNLGSHSEGVILDDTKTEVSPLHPELPAVLHSGRIRFQNPKHMLFVPLVTSVRNYPYTTEATFVLKQGVIENTTEDYVIVNGNAMDTSGRFGSLNFTLAIIGFDKPIK